MIFDGPALAREIEKSLRKDSGLKGKRLVIIQADGEEKESGYIRLKREMGESLGVEIEVRDISKLQTLKKEILKLGEDPRVDGVMVQLPIKEASRKERDEVLRLISFKKDVDGLNPEGNIFLPSVVVAVERVFNLATETLKEKDKKINLKIGIVGSEGIVGKALVKRFEILGHRVIGIDMGDDLGQLKNCDVVISATGKKGLIKSLMIKEGVVVIDLGYPKGDFDKEVESKAKFFTPVPKGVGPLTIVSLFENLKKS
jgi:methylenetetrahydrofolate dehydrogenase (NADP+) / methenyltetrahydrofolate cyclohydrolase